MDLSLKLPMHAQNFQFSRYVYPAIHNCRVWVNLQRFYQTTARYVFYFTIDFFYRKYKNGDLDENDDKKIHGLIRRKNFGCNEFIISVWNKTFLSNGQEFCGG